MIHKQLIKKVIPRKTGVYFLFNDNKELVYIGRAKNLHTRLSERVNENYWLDHYGNIKPFQYVRYSVYPSFNETKQKERELIKNIKPLLNNKSKKYFLQDKKFDIKKTFDNLKWTNINFFDQYN